jgi:hypothetical protein
MQRVTRAGFERRTKVNLIWVGTTLRMEARGLRLELRPVAEGVHAVFLKGAEPIREQPADLEADSTPLIASWMTMIDEQKKRDEAEAAAAAAEIEAALRE